MEEKRDDGFDARVHDAYEQVSLSPQAEERILGALLAAQAECDAAGIEPDAARVAPFAPAAPDSTATPDSTAAHAVPSASDVATAPAAKTPAAAVLPGPAARRRSRLAIVLPAAACLVIAALVGRSVLGGLESRDMMLSSSAVYEAAVEEAAEEEASEEVATEDAFDAGAAEGITPFKAEGASAYDGVDAGAAAEPTADGGGLMEAATREESKRSALAACVILEDGTTHVLVMDDEVLVEVDPELAGEHVGAGELLGQDGTSLGSCEVYLPVDESGLAGHWLVLPDGADACYLADLAS